MENNMEKYEIEHIRRVRELSSECILFLKRNGDFPLDKPCKVALYGNAARKTIKGGTGSGDVNVRHYVGIEEGFENAGFTVTSKKWLDSYEHLFAECEKKHREDIKQKILTEGISAIMLGVGAIMAEPEYDFPLDAEGDVAIYVLGRNSGEGSDRSVESGNFELSETEIRDILRLKNTYKKFLLVLNTGGVVDISPVLDRVDNILLLSQLGIAIGDALADVLLGKSYPSGKLTTTWAKWDDYCHEGDFGDPDDTRYKEGIYVGYRYFETFRKKPLFPFGYGLSYTDFSIEFIDANTNGSNVNVKANVKNVGSFRGKEVAQLYVTIPEGRLDQPSKVLCAFCKTKELLPGEHETVTLSFDIRSIASFDEESTSSILESGEYILHLGSSVSDTFVCAVLSLDEDTAVQELHSVGGEADFTDLRPSERKKYCIPDGVKHLEVRSSDIIKIVPETPSISEKAEKIAESLSIEEAVYLCTGAFDDGNKHNSIIGNAGFRVPGSAGETTDRLQDKGIPVVIMADGPAGLRLNPKYGVDERGTYSIDDGTLDMIKALLPDYILKMLGLDKEIEERHGEIHYQYCTAIPIGTALAQSWSEDVCKACGDIVAEEMERFGVHIWLAPAMNIHRLPLCGRNFEYFSEDPLISGKTAAAITNGVQAHSGCGVSIKHFCANNQETNRMHSNSIMSQRTLRDIYLKGFEIAVKESDPATVMSSYNLLNGEHTSSRYDLLETLLREEWGYKGIVMSDWVSGNVTNPNLKYPVAVASGAIKAGNDIMMPGTAVHYQDIMAALNNPEAKYPLAETEIRRCAARMIDLALKLNKENVL